MIIYDWDCEGFVPHVPLGVQFIGQNEPLSCARCHHQLWLQASSSGPSGWYARRHIHIIEEEPV